MGSSPTPAIAIVFQADPPVDAGTIAEWQADIETVVPRSDRVPWLKLVWQAGMPYEPVARFELYEMTRQLDWVPLGTREALEGPNPRTVGVWISDPSVPGGRRWVSDSIVSLMQWNLYRETGCYGQRFWIIQGAHGGHKWRLSPAERAHLAVTHGMNPEQADTPYPGQLPYAPYDERVKQQIIRMDRLRQWRRAMAWEDRSSEKQGAAALVQEHRRALKRQYEELTLQWLDEQVYEAVSMASRAALAKVADAPPGDPRYNADQGAIERHLVES